MPPLQAGTIPASPVNPADFGQKLLLSEDELIKWIRSRLLHDTACPLLRPEHEDDFFGIYVFTAARRFLLAAAGGSGGPAAAAAVVVRIAPPPKAEATSRFSKVVIPE